MKKPTKPGWYWVRVSGRRWQCIEVYGGEFSLCCRATGDEEHSVGSDIFQWGSSEPIPTPEAIDSFHKERESLREQVERLKESNLRTRNELIKNSSDV